MRLDVTKEDRVLVDIPGQLHEPEVNVAHRLGHLDGHGHDIEVRVHGPGVRCLVAGNLPLGNDRVHDAAEVALPRVGSPSEQRASRSREEVRPLQGREGPDDGCRVTRNHAGGLPPHRLLVVPLGHERVARHPVLLASL